MGMMKSKKEAVILLLRFPGRIRQRRAVLAWNLRKRNAGQNRNSPKKFIIPNSYQERIYFQTGRSGSGKLKVDYKDDIEKLLETYFLQKISANTAGELYGKSDQ